MVMKTNRTLTLLFGLAVAALMIQGTTTAAPSAKFGMKWHALIGEWKGESGTGGIGACGFHLSLSDYIIVRTNHAALPGVAGKTPSSHDDLMVIYPGATEDKARAMYFDNEGHALEYDADWSADGNTLTFLSKPGTAPQFRLTYKRADAKTFLVTFEIAPPGQSTFKVHASGKIRREGG